MYKNVSGVILESFLGMMICTLMPLMDEILHRLAYVKPYERNDVPIGAGWLVHPVHL